MESSRNATSVINTRVHSSAFSRKDDLVDNIVSKLITPKGKASNEGNKTNLPTQHELQPIMRDTMQRAKDADNAFDVLPDLELVAQIAISSILSSKDLITTTVNYGCNDNDLPFELKGKLVRLVGDHFKDDYKLQSYLYDILYDVMFKTGSYAVAVIPESSIDAVIKSGREGVGVESIKSHIGKALDNVGILGSTADPVGNKKIGLESLHGTVPLKGGTDATIPFNKDGEVTEFGDVIITDNMDILKLPKVAREMASSKVASTYNTSRNAALSKFKAATSKKVGAESGQNRNINNLQGKAMTANGKDLAEFDNTSYDDSPYSVRQIEEIPTATDAERPSMGHPLVQHLPSESVIPVHVPGDFKMHVGYLVLLDKLGNPVNRHDMMNTTQAWSWIAGDASSQLMNQAAEGLGYGSSQDEKWTIAKLTECYSDLVDRKLRNSLENGVYGDTVTITRPQEVYRIMMARALAKKQTQILYIPVEQMTYFAFDYTDAGIGRSLTDKNKVITAGRTAIMFATLQSSVLNATRNMQYNIELDADDREPEKTLDDVQHRIMQAYGGRVPFTGTINDVEAYFANAGISFNIEGNDYYPSTKVSVTDNTPDYKVPDRDIDEELAKRNYRGYGVDPDLILTPGSIEFATQVLSKDLIATKQTCKRQEKLAPLITHFCRSYILSSGSLINDIADEIIAHYTAGERELNEGEMGHYLNRFINNFTAELPPPDMSLIASQMDAYEEESKAIEEIVQVYMDDDFLGSLGIDDLDMRNAQSMMGNYLKRNWFRDNGVLPDLTDMFDDKSRRQEFVKAIADDNVNISEFVMMTSKRVKDRMSTIQKNLGDGDEGGDEGGEFGGEPEDGGEFNEDADADFGSDDGFDTDGGDGFEEEEDTAGDDPEEEEEPEEEEVEPEEEPEEDK